ncbi:radical SAM protein [bacterium]|nr:radical SAM protein [bacterium]
MKKTTLLISLNKLTVPYPVFPLALVYLHGFLKEKLPSHDIILWDPLVHTATIEEIILQHNPDYIALSIRNIDNTSSLNELNFIGQYRDFIDNLRYLTKATLIVGGSGFSIFPLPLFEFLSPDFGIAGEGEVPLQTLLKTLDARGDYTSIPGVVYRSKGAVIHHQNHSFLNYQRYSFHPDFIEYYWQHSGMLNLQTKRGCAFDCIYCTYPVIDGDARAHQVAELVETVATLYRKYGITYIFFTDSVFNMFPAFNRAFAEALIAENLPKFRWGGYFSPKNLSKEELSLYKKAGLEHIEFGTESLSDTVLKAYNKPFLFEDVKMVSQFCIELDIHYSHFLILGGYGETNETIEETFENAKLLKNTVFFPYVGMRIYPHTHLKEYAIAEGVISKDDTLLENRFYLQKGVDLSLERLGALAAKSQSRWIFPDENDAETIEKMRKKQFKGPLWEYLIR